MTSPVLVTFSAGAIGPWHIERIVAVAGEGLPPAERLAVHEEGKETLTSSTAWVLRGMTSHARYTTRAEANLLSARQEALGRAEALQAALIPIRKTETWWALAQDERREIFEEQSRHIAIGLEYLPAVARRLHHSRELGEPFDFLTWFEYASEHAQAFEELVARLRDTQEWRYAIVRSTSVWCSGVSVVA